MDEQDKATDKILEEHFLYNIRGTRQSKTLSIATLVGLAHIISGLCVFITASALSTTPLYAITVLFRSLHFHHDLIAAILIFVGVLAILGNLQFLPQRIYIFCFIPQQFIILLQIYSITSTVFTGHYPDGYVPVGESWFILSDQIWAFMLGMAYTLWFAILLGTKSKNGSSLLTRSESENE